MLSPAPPRSEANEATLITLPEPRASRCGPTARVQRMVVVRFTSITKRRSSSDRLTSGPRIESPRLLTRMSSRPKSRRTCATARSTSAARVMSATRGTTFRLVERASSAASGVTWVAVRLLMATSAPAWASTSAMPLPMPRPAPVISATLPSSRYSGMSMISRQRTLLAGGLEEGRIGPEEDRPVEKFEYFGGIPEVGIVPRAPHAGPLLKHIYEQEHGRGGFAGKVSHTYHLYPPTNWLPDEIKTLGEFAPNWESPLRSIGGVHHMLGVAAPERGRDVYRGMARVVANATSA